MGIPIGGTKAIQGQIEQINYTTKFKLMSFTVYTQKDIEAMEARIVALEKRNENLDKVTKMLTADERTLKPDLAGQAVTEPEEILVPDSIVFEKNCGHGDELSIVFNNGKQILYFERDIYKVSYSCVADILKGSNFKLVKIQPEDREVGHTYFRTDEDDFSSIKDGASYCKYLGNKDYVWIGRGGVFVDQIKWDHWYKVVRI